MVQSKVEQKFQTLDRIYLTALDACPVVSPFSQWKETGSSSDLLTPTLG